MRKTKHKVKTKNMIVFCFVVGLISLIILLIMYWVYNSVENENIKNNKRKVQIKNIEVSILGEASYDNFNNGDDFLDDYIIKLKKPGDGVSFIFDITNNSNSNYIIEEFVKKDIHCNGNGINAVDDALLVCSHIDYSLTYIDGEQITAGDSIAAKTYKKAVLKIIFEDYGVSPNEVVEVTGFNFKLSVKK